VDRLKTQPIKHCVQNTTGDRVYQIYFQFWVGFAQSVANFGNLQAF